MYWLLLNNVCINFFNNSLIFSTILRRKRFDNKNVYTLLICNIKLYSIWII